MVKEVDFGRWDRGKSAERKFVGRIDGRVKGRMFVCGWTRIEDTVGGSCEEEEVR